MLIFAVLDNGSLQHKETVIDESLFNDIACGDKQAFCELYQKTRGAVFSYVLSFLRNQADAEDAMQDTYLRIRSAAHLYRPNGKPMAWIFTIARNVSLMKLRRHKKAATFIEKEAASGFDFSQIGDFEDRLVLETAFKALSEQECSIIILHAAAGLKHREIGELLGLSLSAVLSKYNRGIKKLRVQLEEIL